MSEKRNKIFGNLKIIPRLIIIFTFIPLVIFSGIATYVYIYQRDKIFKENQSQIAKNLSNLSVSVMIDRNKLIEQNSISLNTFKSFVYSNKSFFNFYGNIKKYEAKNVNNGTKNDVELTNWSFRGDSIIGNNKFMKALSLSLKSDLVIAQKTKIGYVNITSTVNEFEFLNFPYSSDIVYTIENGETYDGTLKINKSSYYIKATPLYINGNIQGMLVSLVKNKLSKELMQMFSRENYFGRGYAFAVDINGNLIIHPTLSGESIIYSNLFDRISKIRNNITPKTLKYRWPENQKGEIKHLMTVYIPEIETFIGITFFDKDFFQTLRLLRLILIFSVIISVLTLVLSVVFVTNNFFKQLKQINENIQKLSEGIIPNKIKNIEIAEIESILEVVYVLIDNFSKLEQFTEHLKNNDYKFEYKKWGNSDKIGTNLLVLKDQLSKSKEAAVIKQKEQDRLIWLNEGVSKFIEILKYQVIEIKDLAYKIISQVVEYVDANEGGFFIVTKNEDGEKIIELLAAYGMNKEKLLKRQIPYGVGLIGRVALEKKLLYLTEVPESYTKISTALGYGVPNSIVILPLLFNDDVIGVIELSSLRLITDLQLEFLEKITENISANLAMWQASQQTSKLLQESQEQASFQEKQQKELENHLLELQSLRIESEQREIELNSMIKAVDTTALLVEYDINGTLISANNRFLETLDKEEDELIGKNHREITSMDISSVEYSEFWEQLLSGVTKRFIESFSLKDRTVWLSQNYVPIIDNDDNVFKVLNIAIDITENKILEKQLRSQVKEISQEARKVRKEQRKIKQERDIFYNSEQAFNAVTAGIRQFIGHVEFSIDGTIIYKNSKFAEIFEYDIDLIEYKNIKDFVANQSIELFKLAIEKVKNGEEYSSTVVALNSHNEELEIKYSMVPAKNSKNKVEKIIMIISKR